MSTNIGVLKYKSVLACVLVILLFSTLSGGPATAAAQSAPEAPSAFSSTGTINFQGQLTNIGGSPISGSYNMRFAIYDAASGGARKWPASAYEGHISVPVNGGLFSVQLGSVDYPISQYVFNGGGDRYLQVWVCTTTGGGCSTYDDLGRLPISTAAYAQTLSLPASLSGNIAGSLFSVNNQHPGGFAGRFQGVAANVLDVQNLANGGAINAYADHAIAISAITTSGLAGVYGLASSTTGNNYGVWGEADSSTGRGVYGWAKSMTGVNYGVYGQTESDTGRGVYGFNSSPNGIAYGVYGETNSTNGSGVFGYASSTTGPNIGVYGRTESSSGYAGYFYGDVRVIGSFSASSKAFIIDHPLDPANQYLYHYSIEAPQPLNLYRGTVVLDGNGSAVVQLPDYFDAINIDFSYQLTPIGAPMPNLYVSQEVQGNSFQIAGGAPGMKVSWQVTAQRNDPWVRDHGFATEAAKPAEEIGTYLYPQGYGQPAELGRDYQDLSQ